MKQIDINYARPNRGFVKTSSVKQEPKGGRTKYPNGGKVK